MKRVKRKKSTEGSTTKRLKLIRCAGIIALVGNLILAVLKLFAGFINNSLAVIGDGIDTTTDVAIACMTLIVSSIIVRPSDKKHPWGHGRAESTGTMALAFLIFFAGTQLALSALQSLISGTSSQAPSRLVLIVTSISIVGKILLAFSQFILGKKANSSIVRANAQNMLNDIVISGSVLFGLLVVLIFDMPILDPIIALLVSAWIIKNAIKLFWEMNTELMDGNDNKELYEQLFDAIRSIDGVSNPHRARIRKMASSWDIDLDIEVAADMSVFDAHEKSEQVSTAIRNAIPDVYDIMVHIEPAGHQDEYYEGYGLREEDVQTERNWHDTD